MTNLNTSVQKLRNTSFQFFRRRNACVLDNITLQYEYYKLSQKMVANSPVAQLFLILFLIVKLTEQSHNGSDDAEDYRCILSVPENCQDNPRIRVSKADNKYQLQLCSIDGCTNDTERIDRNLNWISCKDICDACQSLLGSEENSKNMNCALKINYEMKLGLLVSACVSCNDFAIKFICLEY